MKTPQLPHPLSMQPLIFLDARCKIIDGKFCFMEKSIGKWGERVGKVRGKSSSHFTFNEFASVVIAHQSKLRNNSVQVFLVIAGDVWLECAVVVDELREICVRCYCGRLRWWWWCFIVLSKWDDLLECFMSNDCIEIAILKEVCLIFCNFAVKY